MSISNESLISLDNEERLLVQTSGKKTRPLIQLLSKITSGMNNSEIMEWRMELRSNEVSMAEENAKAKKKKKLEDEEKREERLADREREVAETRDNLRRLEFKFKENKTQYL